MAVDAKKRVKLYSYNENLYWDDIGTGHVSMDFVERNNALTIIVRSEEDGSVLLESKVLPDRAYQKQEETLIVWTEDDSCDLAISFQEKAGCDDMWANICKIQGRNPDLTVTQDLSEDGELSDQFENTWASVKLPPCELSMLEDIEHLVFGSFRIVLHRENLSVAIEKEGYIMKLIELFHICEDLENTEALKHLHMIFRGLLLLNRAALLQIMFQDDIIVDVIGCLEYEPGKPYVRHRDFLSKMSQRKVIIPFTNPDLLPKIHQTYRVQYIQDVILPAPSLFEENRYAALNSFLLFNKTEIVKVIQEDNVFLRQLFNELIDEGTPVDRYRDLVELLREICNFSLALELKERTLFYDTLCSFDFMKAAEVMLVSKEGSVVTVAVDILQSMSDSNGSIPHILETMHSVTEDRQLLNILISLLLDGEHVEIDLQLVGLVKSVLTPEIAEPTNAITQQFVVKSYFLKFVYQHCMHRLMAPLMDQTATERISKDTYANAVILSHILDILSLCVERHTHHIRNYIIENNILARVLVLMTSSHGHLVLSALRFCRRIVGLSDEFYNRYIVRNNLFSPILKKFMANGQRYNLINSAVIELFDFITKEKIKSLIAYVVDNFMPTLDSIEYVDTFKSLKLVYDQEKDRQENRSEEPDPLKEGILHNASSSSRFRRDARELDQDEEAWFNNEEEQLSPVTTTATSSPKFFAAPLTSSTSPTPSLPSHPSPFTHVSYSPRPNKPPPGHASASKSTNTAVMRSQALLILADYDEDSDEENEQDVTSPAKRQKLNDS